MRTTLALVSCLLAFNSVALAQESARPRAPALNSDPAFNAFRARQQAWAEQKQAQETAIEIERIRTAAEIAKAQAAAELARASQSNILAEPDTGALLPIYPAWGWRRTGLHGPMLGRGHLGSSQAVVRPQAGARHWR